MSREGFQPVGLRRGFGDGHRGGSLEDREVE
jgi:hypothetical protein